MNINNKQLNTLFLIIVFSLTSYTQEKSEEPETIPELKIGDDGSHIKLGGALRFNYNFSNWVENSKKEGGEFGYDAFWLEASGEYKKLTFNAQYRIYAENSGGGMLKQGWIGYKFNQKHEIQVGQNIVPFGPLPYNSNNWFFNITYYLGLEDNADMGIKYRYDKDDWGLDLAFYKNSDMLDFHSDEGITGNHRYAYDVGGRNKEVNKGNARILRHFSGSLVNHEIGLSGQIGGLYNLDTKKTGSHTAFGLHYVLNYGNWNLKAQAITYNKAPKNAEEITDPETGEIRPNQQNDAEYVEMGAYGALYNVAAKANVYTAALSYNIPVNKGILDDVTIYNDFGMLDKRNDKMEDSYQNVTGVLFTIGPVFTYVDYALGKNHAWLGEEWTDAFSSGTNSWGGRFNINIGYYF